MPIIDQGETYSSPNLEVRDASNVLGNAGAAPTITVTQPDLTAGTPPTATSTGTGVYVFDYTPTQLGYHSWVATATGGVLGTATRKWEGDFTVTAAGLSVVSVDDVIAHLRAQGLITAAADREQVRWMALAATSAVEEDLGIVLTPRTVTSTYDGRDFSGWGQAIQLDDVPVISVTTVVENGVTLNSATDYVLKPATGTLYRGGINNFRAWRWGRQNITVTSVAGFRTSPAVLRKVVLNLIERSWQVSQTAGHSSIESALADSAFVGLASHLEPIEQHAYENLRFAGSVPVA